MASILSPTLAAAASSLLGGVRWAAHSDQSGVRAGSWAACHFSIAAKCDSRMARVLASWPVSASLRSLRRDAARGSDCGGWGAMAAGAGAGAGVLAGDA